MARGSEDKLEELLQTMIVLQMFALGASQDRIAKVVGRQKLWVNTILKGMSRPKLGPARDIQTAPRRGKRMVEPDG